MQPRDVIRFALSRAHFPDPDVFSLSFVTRVRCAFPYAFTRVLYRIIIYIYARACSSFHLILKCTTLSRLVEQGRISVRKEHCDYLCYHKLYSSRRFCVGDARLIFNPRHFKADSANTAAAALRKLKLNLERRLYALATFSSSRSR